MAYYQDTDYELALRTLARLDSRSVIDVGAETGTFVDACLARGASTVVAFEPYPPHAVRLREKFNGTPAVQIFEFAIGEKDQTTQLHIATDADGRAYDYYHSLVKFDDSVTIKWDSGIPVMCRSLGRLVTEGTLPAEVGLLKIDTEGADYAVLQGMGALRPSLILLEYWEGLPETGSSPYRLIEVAQLLAERGFTDSVFVKRHDEFEVVQLNDLRTRAGDWGNLLFIHEDVRADVLPAAFDLMAEAHERLIDRAVMFKKQCAARMEVINDLHDQAEQRLKIIMDDEEIIAQLREAAPEPAVSDGGPVAPVDEGGATSPRAVGSLAKGLVWLSGWRTRPR